MSKKAYDEKPNSKEVGENNNLDDKDGVVLNNTANDNEIYERDTFKKGIEGMSLSDMRKYLFIFRSLIS